MEQWMDQQNLLRKHLKKIFLHFIYIYINLIIRQLKIQCCLGAKDVSNWNLHAKLLKISVEQTQIFEDWWHFLFQDVYKEAFTEVEFLVLHQKKGKSEHRPALAWKHMQASGEGPGHRPWDSEFNHRSQKLVSLSVSSRLMYDDFKGYLHCFLSCQPFHSHSNS